MLGSLIYNTWFFVAKAEIFVRIGVSGRIKGRACGFEVGGAQGSEERLLAACQPNGKGHSAEASQDLGASVMPKGLVQLVHAPGSAVPVAPGGGDTRAGGP